MPELLARIAGELRALVATADELQSVVGDLVMAEPRRGADHMAPLQGLDRLSQTLAGMADFLQALSQAIPRNCQADARAAAAGMTLAELASRLTQARGNSMPPLRAAPGNYEHFGAPE
jgi:hypothetical protein